jgi:hypothetical protein
MNNTKLLNLYLVDAVLLIIHEIDSAFWKEWDLFGLPGGIELFLILNFVMVYFALVGLKHLAVGNRKGYYYALILSAAGIGAFIVHGRLILAGHPEFKTIMSIAILALFFIVSLVLGMLTIQIRWKKTSL